MNRLFLLILALVFLPISAGGSASPPMNRIPPIAHIADFTVGVDTIEDMEHRFGPAKTASLVHPTSSDDWRDSRITWRAASDHTVIVADYADFNKEGRLIDHLIISRKKVRMPLGSPRLLNESRRSLAFAGQVWLGMTRGEVIRRLEGILPSPTVDDGYLEWDMKGYALITPAQGQFRAIRYTRWDATMTFAKGRLDEIDVSCDY
jgi:hypothetical protein